DMRRGLSPLIQVMKLCGKYLIASNLQRYGMHQATFVAGLTPRVTVADFTYRLDALYTRIFECSFSVFEVSGCTYWQY
ncbi:MAG TPA: hypothetical protein VJ993_07875, partial [Woeseiaceae bacterium]|nr:hypothetical protein [Woeseiaceae bacterium]